MKNLLMIIPSFLIALLGIGTMAAGNDATVLQGKDNGKEIQVKAGSMIRLSLEERGGTGYAWEFDQLDEQHFEVIKVETRPLVEKNRVGGPILKTWLLKAKNPGETRLSLDYFRSWEGRAKAAEHYLVKVRIQ
jgi:predicted secreted protein